MEIHSDITAVSVFGKRLISFISIKLGSMEEYEFLANKKFSHSGKKKRKRRSSKGKKDAEQGKDEVAESGEGKEGEEGEDGGEGGEGDEEGDEEDDEESSVDPAEEFLGLYETLGYKSSMFSLTSLAYPL